MSNLAKLAFVILIL